ncbi:hypothetical protein N9913_02245, partial [Porticoccaceae bacterium]|nr:hypothetical protein [Porticoccaceae bacterium]
RYHLEECLIKHYENVSTIRLPALFGTGLKKNVIFDFLNNRPLDGLNANSKFQWFDLDSLSEIIDAVDFHGIRELNVCSYPLSVQELLNYVGVEFNNNCAVSPAVKYDITSIHANKFNNINYLYDKQKTLESIGLFCKNWKL